MCSGLLKICGHVVGKQVQTTHFRTSISISYNTVSRRVLKLAECRVTEHSRYLSGYDVPLQSRHSLCTPITPAPAALYFGALPLSSAECSAEEADQI